MCDGLALYDLAGVGLWAGLWVGVGYVFSDAVAVIAGRVAASGLHLGIVLGALLGGYILVKYLRRRLYLRRLRTASISPEALKLRLDGGESLTIVDLRTSLEVAAVPHAKRQGITRVHPLKGGLAGWMALSFPVADLRSREPTAPPPTLSRPDQAERG